MWKFGYFMWFHENSISKKNRVYKNYEPGKLRTKYEPEIFYNLFPWFVFCQLLIKIIKYQPSMYSTLGFRKYFVKPAYNTKITKI